MVSRLSALLLFIACSSVLAQSPSKPVLNPCRARPDLVGKCFIMYGRLSLGNGTPSIRLWKVSSKRILGVLDPEDISGEPGLSTIPASIKAQLDFDKYIFGNFMVCPLTHSRPKEMQTVCIESGRNLIVRSRK